jgi:hypothetical protein
MCRALESRSPISGIVDEARRAVEIELQIDVNESSKPKNSSSSND